MKDRIFIIVLITIVALCLILTAAHMIWAVDAYRHCSIIYFIAKELW
nr:hypothetical protein [Clostridia bacterium]